MYASVAIFMSQPGKLDELLTAFRDKIVPVIKESAIQHEYVLTDAKTNKVIAIALYETEAEAEQMQISGEFQRLIGMMADTLIVESVTRGGYDVSIQV